MRTTVTLDSDVEHILKEESHRTRKSFKEVLNAAVRKALSPPVEQLPALLPPRRLGMTAGIDPRSLSGLADDMEADAFLKITRRKRQNS